MGAPATTGIATLPATATTARSAGVHTLLGAATIAACTATAMMPDWLAQIGVLEAGSLSARLARVTLLAAVFGAEWFLPADDRQRPWSPGLAHDVVWYAALRAARLWLVLTYLRLLGVLYRDVLALPVVPWEHAPVLARALVALVLRDFLAWASHCARHRIALFWPWHEMHHSQRQMNVYLAHRGHPFDDLIDASLIGIPAFALGLHIEAATVLAVFAVWYPMICHANLRSDFGLLRFLMVTPQSHRMHHTTTDEGIDRNFGTIFSIWDRLFGTHCEPAPDSYPPVGLHAADDSIPPRWRDIPIDLWRNMVGPFQRLKIGRR